MLENDPPFNHVSLKGRSVILTGMDTFPLGAVSRAGVSGVAPPMMLEPMPLAPRSVSVPMLERRAPSDVETALVKATAGILRDVAGVSLKARGPARVAHPELTRSRVQAVELANMLRARMGTETLAAVREHHGGLLALLERHPSTFRVTRIPKNDCVALVTGASSAATGTCSRRAPARGMLTECACSSQRRLFERSEHRQ